MKTLACLLVTFLLSSSFSGVYGVPVVFSDENVTESMLMLEHPSFSVSFLTYLGGNGEDWLRDVCFDEAGNIWVLGYTESTDLPLVNAIQETYGGQGDALLAKFSSQYEMEFCTYFGGDGIEYGMALNIDPNGDIVVVGNTQSTNLFTLDALQSDLNGTSDAFVTKFNPDGNIIFSTYFGGSGVDFIYKLDFDSDGNYVMAGSTGSTDLQTTDGVLQQTYGGGASDMMFVSMTSDGQEILFCSYYGDSAGDDAYDIELDSEGNIGIIGVTGNNDLVTSGTFQQEYGGGLTDAIVTKLTPNCDAILWTTLLGGDGWEFGDGILFDSQNNLILSGYSGSSNFPLLNQIIEDQDDYDAFLVRLSHDGGTLLFGTYLGGDGQDRSYGLSEFANESTIILCQAGSDGMPVYNSLQQNNSGSSDAYLAVFDINDQLVYGTYVGGSRGDYSTGITVSDDMVIGFTGYSNSDDLPVVNPTQAERGGSDDGFLCILSLAENAGTDLFDVNVTVMFAIVGIGVVAIVIILTVFLKRR
ncbi:MAG: hypothetical protein KAR33_08825 [Candidatus Thorarchaeota archaeon]|nr:hypothetical protein [Candidatus Thorarchaeota archaeon]